MEQKFKYLTPDEKIHRLQKKLIGTMISSIIYVTITIVLFGFLHYDNTVTYDNLLKVTNTKDSLLINARDSLNRELIYRDNNYNHPFAVVISVTEAYPYFNRKDKLKADSVLSPIILSLKRAGLCK